MATFNKIGCCVCRDIFGLKYPCSHEVKHFLQFSSPITWFVYNEKPNMPISIETIDELSGGGEEHLFGRFVEKCVVNDYNKTVLDYYQESSDFFILDFASLLNDGLVKQTLEDGSVHYFTCSGRVVAPNCYGKSILDLLPGQKEKIDIKELIDEDTIDIIIERMYKWLCEKNYKQSQIILVEVMHAEYYSDSKSIQQFENYHEIQEKNRWLALIYSKFKAKMKNCKVIQLPNNYYGDSEQKWGLYSLHYCQEVYDYLYDVVDLIANYQEDIDEKIIKLKDKYYQRMERNLNNLKLFETTYINLVIEQKKNQKLLGIIEDFNKNIQTVYEYPLIYGKVHISCVGWMNKKYENEYMGDYESNLGIEAIVIDELSENYKRDIYYSVRIGNVWLPEVKNGQMAGTVGEGKAISGFKMRIEGCSVEYKIFDSKKGWILGRDNEELVVTTGDSLITSIMFTIISD